MSQERSPLGGGNGTGDFNGDAPVRGADGRFLPGNPRAWKKGTSGNPGGRSFERFRRVLHKVFLERWERVIEAMVRQAELGNVDAFRALARFLIPPMPKDVNLEMIGGSPAGDALEIRIVGIEDWRPDVYPRRLPPSP